MADDDGGDDGGNGQSMVEGKRAKHRQPDQATDWRQINLNLAVPPLSIFSSLVLVWLGLAWLGLV